MLTAFRLTHHNSDSDPLNSSHDSQGLSELAESKEDARDDVVSDQADNSGDGDEALLDTLSKYIQYITENPGLIDTWING